MCVHIKYQMWTFNYYVSLKNLRHIISCPISIMSWCSAMSFVYFGLVSLFLLPMTLGFFFLPFFISFTYQIIFWWRFYSLSYANSTERLINVKKIASCCTICWVLFSMDPHSVPVTNITCVLRHHKKVLTELLTHTMLLCRSSYSHSAEHAPQLFLLVRYALPQPATSPGQTAASPSHPAAWWCCSSSGQWLPFFRLGSLIAICTNTGTELKVHLSSTAVRCAYTGCLVSFYSHYLWT